MFPRHLLHPVVLVLAGAKDSAGGMADASEQQPSEPYYNEQSKMCHFLRTVWIEGGLSFYAEVIGLGLMQV